MASTQTFDQTRSSFAPLLERPIGPSQRFFRFLCDYNIFPIYENDEEEVKSFDLCGRTSSLEISESLPKNVVLWRILRDSILTKY